MTRHEPGVYTVNLSSDIPYGTNMERVAMTGLDGPGRTVIFGPTS